MKRLLFTALALLGGTALLLAGTGAAVGAAMPPYRDSVGDVNYTEKITGISLLRQSAAQDDNLIIFGSSELRTTEISTHPANFFAGKRSGFQVNLIGRGSCQSLIHAISIAASGDSLTGKKVVLITSPQSYVPQGIAPDLFMANFSPQQYLELLEADDLTEELKQSVSARVAELFDEYAALPDAAGQDVSIRWKAGHRAAPGLGSGIRDAALTPYYQLDRYLYGLRDQVTARSLLNSVEEAAPAGPSVKIDWAAEAQAATAEAQGMSGNNSFGMLDGYYTTYIGPRLSLQKDRDRALDYSASEEYSDLRLLFEVCRQKGIEPLFIHVPLHGQWSDYTGFSAEKRRQYYQNVSTIAQAYGIETLDLTGYEYEPYFLCDVMHLGWKGWLQVDRALIDYYYSL